MRTYVWASDGPPTSPSATAHRTPVVVAPGELCASLQAPTGVAGNHIDRSAMIGTPFCDSTIAETAALSSGRSPDPAGNSSVSTDTVTRLLAVTG